MKLNKMLREMDMFGQGIQWRLLSKDTFKSIFGALITLFLTAIFVVKIYFFVAKVTITASPKIKQQVNSTATHSF